ncbi:MAG: outer membrane beta-barrel protein, partial [Chitinophagales bacterium]
MRKFIGCLISFLSVAIASYSQTTSIKGTVTDTVEKKNLSNSVITLIRKSDSVLVKFTRTDKDGNFNIKNIPAGKFILQVTYPNFADYIDEITLAPGKEIDLANIDLTPKSKILEEVIVKQNVAIRLKGDTIEYKADSFKVEEGATVKDLLRKLPGLQVDKNGQITAQGQKVEKVLVDGEEFFSDDPAVVIENLRADAVDKVQSYDKKSDQAEFTGIDDGSKTKTLNLVLKDDKKKGYMGKVVVGGGSDERYSEQAMINYFKGKKKISVYGIASNTGTTGLGWDDRSKFGEGNDFGDAEVEVGAGFISINSSGDNDFGDWQNTYYDEGIPRTIKAGAHFSNKWDHDKENFNGNYSLKNMNVDAVGNSLTKYILPDSAYYSKEDHNSHSRQTQQLFNGTYDFQFDSLSSLRVKVNGKIENNDNTTFTNTETDNEDLQAVNKNKRENTSQTNAQTLLASALYRQKFKKKGRTLSLSASQKYYNKNSTGFLNSETDYFDINGNVYNRDTIDQLKNSLSKTLTTTSRLVYTEPTGKKALLEFNYTFNRVGSSSDRKSFDNVNGKYDLLDSLYSIKYGLEYLSNSAGIKYQYTGKKLVANIGTNIGVSNMAQKDSTGTQVRNYHYTNLFPTARINYKFAPQRSLSITYSGSPRPPGIDQIQPILENTNPLFITVGNPGLKQSFDHNISFFFTDFKMLTNRSIWINGSFNPIQNAIVTSQVTDALGKTTQQYVNVKGNYSYQFWGSYGFKLKKLDTYFNLSLNTNGSRNMNFVNSIRNINNQNSLGFGINAGQYKENKYNYNINLQLSNNHQQSSISRQTNNFWSQEHNAEAEVYITKKFVVGSDVNFYYRQKTDAFDKNNNL